MHSYQSLYQELSRFCLPTSFVPFSADIQQFFDADSILISQPPTQYSCDTEEPLTIPQHSNSPVYDLSDLHAVFPKTGPSTFVKLNGTAPTDAMWLYGSLKVHNPESALCLLKSSDKCCDALESSTTVPVIELKPFKHISPVTEFRLVLSSGQLKYIVQRHYHQFYHQIYDYKQEIIDVCTLFTSSLPLPDDSDLTLVMNVFLDVVDDDWSNARPFILDIELWSSKHEHLDFESEDDVESPVLLANTELAESISSSLPSYAALPLEVQSSGADLWDLLRTVRERDE
ncbi:hypothetical protein GEMRC1_002934 [Eukaryota sp. GEM-RC1]